MNISRAPSLYDMTEEAERPTHGTRDRIVVRTSILGIIANLILAAFKAVVGILSNSIAVTLDAVNNMSDAMSSVVTIIGTKLSGKKPDRSIRSATAGSSI